MSRFRPAFGLLCSLVCAASALNTQDVRATIGGRVLDPTGGLVPNASVEVMSDDTNVKIATKTNAKGVWFIELLNPGKYEFTITASGFRTETRKGITLQAADNKQFDTNLQVGTATQNVEVVADAPLVDTTSAVSGTVITQQEINEMPTSSHVVTLLAMLSPGVMRAGPEQQRGAPVVV